MHTSTISDQTDHVETVPTLRYNGTGPDEYLSDSDSYNGESNLGSDDYYNYESNYESDNEEATWSSLYNAYDRDEVRDKLVIKIDQDDRASKFSVADDISEVYSLPKIHECINALYRILYCNWKDILKGLVIATSSDYSKCSYHILYVPVLFVDHHELKSFTELVYTITGEKFGMFIDRKLSGHNFNLRLISSAKKGHVKRILQFSLDNGWNELDHIRVQPPPSLGLEVRPQMLSTEKNNNPLRIIGLDYRRKRLRKLHIFQPERSTRMPTIDEPGEVFKCDPFIAEKIQQENKNSPQSSYKVKAPGFPKAFVKMPSWVKYNDPLTVIETYEERYVRPLSNEGDIYVVLSMRHSYSNAVTTRLNLKSYCDIDGNINLPDHKRAKNTSSLPFENRTSASLICHLRKNIQGIVHILKTDFPELRIKKYHDKSDPVEKAHDFSNVEESWKDVDLVAYTSTLKIGVSCTNSKFERAFCLFNSYIETNAGTNQMLFCMQCIKDYICHIEQRSSNIPVTEKGLFQWLLNAKRECLLQELQNRGIFPDIDSIIWNKDVLIGLDRS
ncbi:hypothetical protein C1646_771644 [Rhizophagus diaphanus]|nr:hypothetical protein C1646_771644 [Rhizophagus diaphanus] [Rhizophagus sp. MUCL 43196]